MNNDNGILALDPTVLISNAYNQLKQEYPDAAEVVSLALAVLTTGFLLVKKLQQMKVSKAA